ncbi:glycosyltransferase family A protein [Celeribacter halophilus]|uniref:glycosyltransferase family 2 protein n=1 Tax=Celeribacter halophilus TaxID=576117 RepID=UPI002FD4D93A
MSRSNADITVAISTIGTGIERLRLPEACAGLTYLILVQQPPSQITTPEVKRADVRVETLPSVGLSHSRNAAIDLCETPFLLFADDDMALNPKGISTLAAHLEQDTELALAAGWRDAAFHAYRRSKQQHALTLFNSGRVCAPEFMVRVDKVKQSNLRFDTGFGVGAPLPTGEDYIFVTDLLKRGLKAQSFPIKTGHHIGDSTGRNWQDATLLHARRAVLSRVFGPRAPLVACAYALRHYRKFNGPDAAFAFCCDRLEPTTSHDTSQGRR